MTPRVVENLRITLTGENKNKKTAGDPSRIARRCTHL